ncbi:hypothetical protein BZA77DRAFT_313721 [Pyronema omphalodes]|nr:hypothetical protein BZA77DRAFT_313721 [Pyronema omphalodes]
MDALSITAAVAGVLSLTDQIAITLKDYIDAVAPAEMEVRSLLLEVTALHQVLGELVMLPRTDDLNGSKLQSSSVLFGAVNACQYQLERLSKRLAGLSKLACPNGKVQVLVTRLRWPLKKEEVQQTMVHLQNFTQIFRFSMLMNSEVMSGTYSAVLLQLDENRQEMVKIAKTLERMSVPVPTDLQEKMSLMSEMKTRVSELPNLFNGSRMINSHKSLSQGCRTFRISELPLYSSNIALCQCLDSLDVVGHCRAGNSKVFSMATYGSWRVATVSFHHEPIEFERCKPGHQVNVLLQVQQKVTDPAAPVSVTIDCEFYGMTPLYEPVGTTAKYDIIAVTGLSAHAYGSWKSPDQADMMWLRDFLPLDLPYSRVLTWGYYSSIQNESSTTSLGDISRKFLEDIKRVRGKETAHRPLILIGHSLGGLVLQKALVDASKSDSEEEKAFHQSSIGLLFFGVPNRGLNEKSIQSLVQGKGNERFLQDISFGSDYLYELERDFEICNESMKNCTVVSFYEGKDTCSVEELNGKWERRGQLIRMVPRVSAICAISKHCNRIQILADHSGMVKFKSWSDENYQRVMGKIKELIITSDARAHEETLPVDESPQRMSFILSRNDHRFIVKLRHPTEDIGINFNNDDRDTAFLRQCENGQHLAVELFLQADGININYKDFDGCTALARASENGHESVVKLLLQADGININTKDRYGRTALSRASKRGYDSVVKLLLQVEGIDINSKDRYGRTALLRASENGHISVVELLLGNAGIEINLEDSSGQTALSWASCFGHDLVANLLLVHGAICGRQNVSSESDVTD